jgi:hypothetical protein
MRAMVEMLNSIKGFELAFFGILLVACQYFYVVLASNPDAGFQLYASAWVMAVLTAMTAIKVSRLARALLSKG